MIREVADASVIMMDDYRYQALRILTRARLDVIQNLTREKPRFANYLFLKCSGIAQSKDIQNTSTTIALKEQVKVLDKAIEQQFEIIPNILTAIPGIGKVYSAGIIAEIGNIHRFDSQASAGWLNLGAANSVRRCGPEFRRYYDRISISKRSTIPAQMRTCFNCPKLVRLAFRLLKDNRPYIRRKAKHTACYYNVLVP